MNIIEQWNTDKIILKKSVIVGTKYHAPRCCAGKYARIHIVSARKFIALRNEGKLCKRCYKLLLNQYRKVTAEINMGENYVVG